MPTAINSEEELGVKKFSPRTTRFVLLNILFVFVVAVILAVTAIETTVYSSITVTLIIVFGLSIALCLYDMQFIIPSSQSTHSHFLKLVGFKKCTLFCFSEFSLSLLISHLTVFLLFFLLLISGIVACVVRYGDFIISDPWSFLTEIGATACFPSIPIILLAWNRGVETKILFVTLCIVSSCLGGLHILLELSGFYAAQFDENQSVSLVMTYEDINNITAMYIQIQQQLIPSFLSHPSLSSLSSGSSSSSSSSFFSSGGNSGESSSESSSNSDVYNYAYDNSYSYCFIIPLIGLVFSSLAVIFAQIRRKCCRDAKKPRPENKLISYAKLGKKMWVLLCLNLFLILTISVSVSQGLHKREEWENISSLKTLSDRWCFWLQLFVIVVFIVIGICISVVSVVTRYVGFITVSPWMFLSEVVILCLLIVFPWGLISYNRGQDHADILQLVIFTCALAGGHTLLELSASYALLFDALYRKDDIQNIERKTVITNYNRNRMIKKEIEEEVNERRKHGSKSGSSSSSSRCSWWMFVPKKFDYYIRTMLKNRVYVVLTLIIILCFIMFCFVVTRDTQTEKTLFIAVLLVSIPIVCAYVMTDIRLEYYEPSVVRKGRCKDIGFKHCVFCCFQEFSLHLFISLILVFALAGFLVLSGGIAVYVRYSFFVRSEFWLFMVEIAMMSLLTTIPVALISWNRGGQSKDLFVESLLISSKFGALHIVLELSGVYEVYYEGKERFGIVSNTWGESNSTQILSLVITQMNERIENAARNERAFLIIVALFFSFSAIGVVLVFLRRKFFRDPDKERSEEKLRLYQALGNRMKALLILSLVLFSLMIPIVILGLRNQEDWEKCCSNLCYYWSEIALGSILAAVVCSFVVLSFAAMFTRFGGFINLSPWSFFGELVVVMLLSMAPLGFLSYNRGHAHENILEELGIFALKFGGLHLLLELAGFYTTALGGQYRRDLIGTLPRSIAAFDNPPSEQLEFDRSQSLSYSNSAGNRNGDGQNDDFESTSRRSVDGLVEETKSW